MSETNPALDGAETVDLQDQRQAMDVVAASVLGLWDVVNNLARLRPTRHEEFQNPSMGPNASRFCPANSSISMSCGGKSSEMSNIPSK